MPKSRDNQAEYFFRQGTNFSCARYFGAHPDGTGRTVFRVWAPHARKVSVEGDFNGWTFSPMAPVGGGIWEAVLRGVRDYDCYKYVIETAEGELLEKADPFAFHTETPPANSSKVLDLSGFAWTDDAWLQRDPGDIFNRPMNIFEVHAGSWKVHEDGNPYSWLDLADELPAYCREMGYTHVELMPVCEYPFDGSWGYQVTGYFAPTSRYGTPFDFMNFIDRCHSEGIGVLLDWVPAHFPKDSHGLALFDGGCCYEDPNPVRGEHREWGTKVFDFGKPEVQSFLISSALFWLETYHADGLRVDAVASMLYLDYAREPGEWEPNANGGRENLEAVAFLRKLNTAVLTRFPKAVMAAEESTDWPGITAPPDRGGLGFNFKWNMGWMNDCLSYLKTDPVYRQGCHGKLTFSLMYAFNENFILPLSHDEVVHGKCSMIGKMPGAYEQKFEGLKAFYAYMYAHPGKKLNFMGNEIAQFIEWRYYEGIEYKLLAYDRHRQFRDFMKVLGTLYVSRPEFWEQDCSWDGFRWINADDAGRNVLSFLRTAKDGSSVTVLINFSASRWSNYVVGVPGPGRYRVLLDSTDPRFGGQQGKRRLYYPAREESWMDFPCTIRVDLEPLSALYLENPKQKKGEKE